MRAETRPQAHIRLDSVARDDLCLWRRMLLGANGVSLIRRATVPDVAVVSDASVYGFGACCYPDWLYGTWLPHELQVAHAGGDLSMPLLELAAAVRPALAWGHRWRGKTVNFLLDCTAASAVLSKGSSSSRFMGSLMRQLALLAVEHDFYFTAGYLPGDSNRFADALSRGQLERFRVLAHRAGTPFAAWPSRALRVPVFN